MGAHCKILSNLPECLKFHSKIWVKIKYKGYIIPFNNFLNLHTIKTNVHITSKHIFLKYKLLYFYLFVCFGNVRTLVFVRSL